MGLVVVGNIVGHVTIGSAVGVQGAGGAPAVAVDGTGVEVVAPGAVAVAGFVGIGMLDAVGAAAVVVAVVGGAGPEAPAGAVDRVIVAPVPLVTVERPVGVAVLVVGVVGFGVLAQGEGEGKEGEGGVRRVPRAGVGGGLELVVDPFFRSKLSLSWPVLPVVTATFCLFAPRSLRLR